MLTSYIKNEAMDKMATIKASTSLLNQYLIDIWSQENFPIDRGEACVKMIEGSLEWTNTNECYLVLTSRYKVYIGELDLEQENVQRIQVSEAQLKSIYKNAKHYEVLNTCYELLPTREKRCQFIMEYAKLPIGARRSRLLHVQTIADVQRMIESLNKAGSQKYSKLIPELEEVCRTLVNMKESKNTLNYSI